MLQIRQILVPSALAIKGLLMRQIYLLGNSENLGGEAILRRPVRTDAIGTPDVKKLLGH